jgi:outer membrane receptor protein involved in Fe transport
LGKTTFHEITLAYKYNRLDSKLYEDTLDSRYVHPLLSSRQGNFYFQTAGNDLTWFERFTKSWIAKWDITSQLTKRHQVKTGVEFQRDEIFYHDLNIIPATDDNNNEIVPFKPSVPPLSSRDNDKFTRKPIKFAAYIQDKIEYESLVINVGFRFDLFDAKGKIPVDLTDPNIYNPFKEKNIYRDLNGDGTIDVTERIDSNKLTVSEREEYWYRDTEVKTLFSPRLGVGFPITDRGVIHFSYGIFQQIPDYNLLYVDDQLKVTTGSGIQGPFGNPDLKPQKTTMYELGLKQQFTDNLAIDITGFYRDIRDWISTTAPVNAFLSGVRYVRNTNRDLANVFGVTLAVKRRFANHFSFDVDYTFQIAEGTNSNPDQEYNAVQGGAEPTRILTPLDWDQTHTLNTNLFVGSGSWGASLISRFNSGQPYTPSFFGGTRTGQTVSAGLPENSRNKPSIFTVDLRAYKNFKYSVFRLQIFARIFNLFDAKNPTRVYGDTGLADKTFDERVDHDSTWFDRPYHYSPPRSIQVGLRLSYK